MRLPFELILASLPDVDAAGLAEVLSSGRNPWAVVAHLVRGLGTEECEVFWQKVQLQRVASIVPSSLILMVAVYLMSLWSVSPGHGCLNGCCWGQLFHI